MLNLKDSVDLWEYHFDGEEEATVAVLAVGRAKDSLQRKILAAVMKCFCWFRPEEIVPPEFANL